MGHPSIQSNREQKIFPIKQTLAWARLIPGSSNISRFFLTKVVSEAFWDCELSFASTAQSFERYEGFSGFCSFGLEKDSDDSDMMHLWHRKVLEFFVTA